MNNSVKKLALTASSIVLSMGVLGATPAQANLVFWNLDFFDESGTLVGEGEFAYDPTTTTFVQTSTFSDSIPIEGFEVQSALEVFLVNVVGDTFSLEDDQPGFVTWWFDSNNNPGQQLIDFRFPIPNIRENRWFFPDGGSGLGDQIFRMNDIEKISNALWVGDWDYINFDTPFEPIFEAGKWSATLRSQAVPEPTTTLGLLAFSAFGVVSAWKHKRK